MSKNGFKFKPVQKLILAVIIKYDGRLTIAEVAKKFEISVNVVHYHIIILERLGLIGRVKAGKKKILFSLASEPKNNGKTLEKTEVDCELMERFNLDALDFRLLDEVNGDESFQELAEKFKVVANQIEARIERSLPAKFEAATKFEVVTFPEAKAIFLKYKKEISTS